MIDLSRETELLAERVAAARHISVDVAVRQALEENANATGIEMTEGPLRGPSAEEIAARYDRIMRIADEIAALPVLDNRPIQEIVDDINAL